MSPLRPRVAVVDDEESVRKALQRVLRAAEMFVDTYATGADFLASVATRRPDCVLLDLHMVGWNGFEVQDVLAQANVRLPVIVLTGHDTPEGRARVLAGGAANYLLKPVDDRMLIDAIMAAIANRKDNPAA